MRFLSPTLAMIVSIGITPICSGMEISENLHVWGRTDCGDCNQDYVPNNANWNYTLLLSGKDATSLGFHDSYHSVSSIRYSGGMFTVGANDGWGASRIYFPGNVGVLTQPNGSALLVGGKIECGDTNQDYIPESTNCRYTLQLNGKDMTSIGFHDSYHSISSIRYSNGTFIIGGNDGWGVMRVLIPGSLGINIQPNESMGSAFALRGNARIIGQLQAQEVLVQATVVPDYVFAPDYQLKSLPEIEAYVQKERHLPGIPSAKEQEKEGVQMGQMLNKHLEKIEELTLYAIQAQKERQLALARATSAEQRIVELEARLQKIEAILNTGSK